MMVKASPRAPLIVAEADFLLELLIIALDSPAQLGEIDEVAQWHVAVNGSPLVAQRSGAIRVANYTHNPIDKCRKSRFTVVRNQVTIHIGLLAEA
jgi:hypothetical protein